jgi:hypothetical protein
MQVFNAQMYADHVRDNVDSDNRRVIATLLKDLARKSLKLAILLSVFNHGEKSFKLTVQDLRDGEAMAYELYDCSLKFFKSDHIGSLDRLITFMVERGDMSARDLLDSGLFPGVNARAFQHPIRLAFEDGLIDEIEGKGFEVLIRKVRKTDLYSIKKIKQ